MRLIRVPLRVSLVGGGSDLPSHFNEYGGAVVSFTINKYIYITVKDGLSLFPHKYRLVYSQVEETSACPAIKHPIIREVLREYNPETLDLDIMSDVPAGTGLGSSSAFTVGLYMAMSNIKDKAYLAKAACEMEVGTLGEPIGYQDQYAAAYGGLNYMKFYSNGASVERLNVDFNLLKRYMHLIYVGGSRSASQQLKEQNNNTQALRHLSALADSAAQALKEGHYDDLGFIIRKGWEIKKSLSPSVSNDKVDSLISLALDSGATGGKLLGAGGTGFVLLFCPPTEAMRMYQALYRLAPKYVPFDFDHEGAKVLYESGENQG